MPDQRRPRLLRRLTGTARAVGAHGARDLSPTMVGKLLIIDEDSAAAATIADALALQGHTVELLPDLDDAVDALARITPDVVIVDPWSTRRRGGTALIARLRTARDPEGTAGTAAPEVVVLTAHRDVDIAVDSLHHGAADFVVKGASSTRIDLAVARALDRRRLLNEHDRLRHDLALFAAAQRLLETFDVTQLASCGLDTLCAFARADAGVMFNAERILAERGLSEAEQHALARLRRPVNFTERIRVEGPVLQRFKEALLLDLDDHRTAVLVSSRGFSTQAEESCIFLARQLHTAFRNVVRFADAERQARRDSLTGLWNARAFQEEVHHLVGEAERIHRPFSVLFLDVDHFKQVNDRFGHTTGSRVLVEIAGVLQRCRRDDDLLARYGGDEFTVLLPDVDTTDAMQIAERIRQAVAEHAFDTAGQGRLSVTVSVGVASFPRHARTAHALLDLADRAMYVGKGSVRNTVNVAAPALGSVKAPEPSS